MRSAPSRGYLLLGTNSSIFLVHRNISLFSSFILKTMPGKPKGMTFQYTEQAHFSFPVQIICLRKALSRHFALRIVGGLSLYAKTVQGVSVHFCGARHSSRRHTWRGLCFCQRAQPEYRPYWDIWLWQQGYRKNGSDACQRYAKSCGRIIRTDQPPFSRAATAHGREFSGICTTQNGRST